VILLLPEHVNYDLRSAIIYKLSIEYITNLGKGQQKLGLQEVFY